VLKFCKILEIDVDMAGAGGARIRDGKIVAKLREMEQGQMPASRMKIISI